MKKILFVLIFGLVGVVCIEIYSQYQAQQSALARRDKFIKMMEKSYPSLKQKRDFRPQTVPYNFPEKEKGKEYRS